MKLYHPQFISSVLLLALFTWLFSVPLALAISDQVKTTEQIIFTSSAQVTAATSTSFSIYIGDDIGSVTNPIKSVYIMISGGYTSSGGGTLGVTLNSDSGTLQQFSLPAATAHAFHILYKDPLNTINPTSAGNYTYTLTLTPSSLSQLSGLSAKAIVTYQYKPATCPDGQPTNEKMKTIEQLVLALPTSLMLNQTTSTDFSIYIGDNISGITNPVKSVYFVVSGLVDNNLSATLNININNNAASTRQFQLPVSTSPAVPFIALYQDPVNTINPTSAGTYAYTMSLGITGTMGGATNIYGLSVKAVVTYQYKPPTCASALPATGDLSSAVFDTTGSAAGPAYNSLVWKGTLGGGTGRVRFQLATAALATGPWNFIGGATCGSSDWYDPGGSDTPIEISCAAANHNNQRYFRYKVQLCSHNDCSTAGAVSPQVDDVIINWSP